MADKNYARAGGLFTTKDGLILEIPPSGFDWRTVRHVVGHVDPYIEEAAQQWPLGTKLSDGQNVYRYAKAGGVAIEVGALCQAVVPLAGHINEVISAPAIGTFAIDFTPAVVTTDDMAANEFQDGILWIYDNTGEGHQYRIKSHPAIVGAVLGVITLMDSIRVAPHASATATILHNKYRGVIIHPSPPTAQPVGWTQFAVTADYFFWLLTRGDTPALIDGTVVQGKQVRPSEDDDGAVADLTYDETTSANNSDYGPVGWVREIGADAAGGAATYGAIHATLD